MLDKQCGAAVVLALAASLLLGRPAAADPGRQALVFGIGRYAAFPALPGCPGSARAVGDVLGRLGFEVAVRQDASNGEMSAALAAFAKRLAANPDATAVIYFCGYGVSYDGRPFLLPASVTLEHDTDVLSEGLIAKALLDTIVRGRPRLGLLLLDVVAKPGSGAPAIDPMAHDLRAAGVFVADTVEPGAAASPTPFAAALTAELGDAVPVPDLLAAVQRRLGAAGVKLALAGTGSASALIAASPASSPVAPPPAAPLAVAAPPNATPPNATPAIATPAEPPPPAASAPATASPAAPAAASPAALPTADAGSQDPRRIQAALKQLGYYPGAIDGVFGPDTRAAIRRYQYEIGAELTGQITPQQAARLLAHAAPGPR